MSVDLDRAIAEKGSFYDWLRLAWPHVEPSPFVPGWHLQEVCAHLEAQGRFELPELVINLPPGHTKSLATNVFWPAWTWTRNPTRKFIYGSYDQSLVGSRDGGKVLDLLQSRWYLDRWGNLLEKTSPSASNFDLQAGGFRFATSIGGRGTGRHGDHVIADDPIKPKDATGAAGITKKALVRCENWWFGTMSTRQANPKRHTRTVMMQRLASDDLAGKCKATGYVVLSLPADKLGTRTQWGGERRSAPGPLHPARYDQHAIDALRRTLGPLPAAAQLDQSPTVLGGNIFRRHMWRFWGTGREPCMCDECFSAGRSRHDSGRDCTALPARGTDCTSWDLAFKGKATSDYVAAGHWRQYGQDFFLVDLLNEHLDFPATKARLIAWRGKAGDRLVEDAANGPAIEAELRTALPITLVKPSGGKEARAHAASAVFETGRVFLPAHHPGVWDFMAQLEGFPMAAHDDQVDQATQAINWLRAKSGEGWKHLLR